MVFENSWRYRKVPTSEGNPQQYRFCVLKMFTFVACSLPHWIFHKIRCSMVLYRSCSSNVVGCESWGDVGWANVVSCEVSTNSLTSIWTGVMLFLPDAFSWDGQALTNKVARGFWSLITWYDGELGSRKTWWNYVKPIVFLGFFLLANGWDTHSNHIMNFLNSTKFFHSNRTGWRVLWTIACFHPGSEVRYKQLYKQGRCKCSCTGKVSKHGMPHFLFWVSRFDHPIFYCPKKMMYFPKLKTAILSPRIPNITGWNWFTVLSNY